MPKYKMDMSGEKGRAPLLPEGWHDFKIKGVVEATSSKGNEMFIITVTHVETGSDQDVYAISTPGKRWFLKMLLAACCIPASEDGVYEWDTSDIIGLIVKGRVEHQQDEPWIDRQGNTRQGAMKGNIVEWKESDTPNEVPGPTFNPDAE